MNNLRSFQRLVWCAIQLAVVGLLGAQALETDVSGYQWGTWTLAGSPYRLVGNVTVPRSALLSDRDGDGVWDPAEPYWDYGQDCEPNTNDPGEGNGQYDAGEPYVDSNSNGRWDRAESYTDLDGNGQWTPLMPSLTIEPGVEVQTEYYGCSNCYYRLDVDGELHANGATFTASLPIRVEGGGQATLAGADCGPAFALVFVWPECWRSAGIRGRLTRWTPDGPRRAALAKPFDAWLIANKSRK